MPVLRNSAKIREIPMGGAGLSAEDKHALVGSRLIAARRPAQSAFGDRDKPCVQIVTFGSSATS